MAVPALNIVELAEDERTVILRANIAEGGDADISNYVLADIADYAAIGPAAVALSIRRVWWSLENLSVDIKFEASTPVKALSLSGNGSYDFAAIHGVKNPGGVGSTGSILLDTYGIAINAALGCVGSLVIEFWKVRSGESGGELDSAATSSLFTPEVPEVSGGIIVGGNSTASGYIQFLEDSDNGSNYVQVQAPASLAANYVLTLPAATGTVLTDQDIGVSVQAYDADLDYLATNVHAETETVGAYVDFLEATNNGTNKIKLETPAALAADYVLTLPAKTGTVLTDADVGVSVQPHSSDLDDLIVQWVPNETQASSLTFRERSTNGTQGITIMAPTALSGNTVLRLPGEYATTGQVLSSTDAGILSWVSQPTASSLGLVIGTNVQAYSANLTDLATNYTAASASGAASIKLYEDTDEGTNFIELKAPALAADVTLTLPTTDGDSSQFLQTNGSGVLTWATVDTALSNDTSPTLGGDLNLDTHKLYTSSDNKNIYMEPHGTGNVVLTDCNLVLSSGYGIDFSATANSSGTMASELFDDYEEGTWTPKVTVNYTTPEDPADTTYNYQRGYYVKIGKKVFIDVDISLNSTSSDTSSLFVWNLPFAPAYEGSLNNANGTFWEHRNYGSTDNSAILTTHFIYGSSTLLIALMKRGAAWTNYDTSFNLADVATANTYIMFSGYYHTTS